MSVESSSKQTFTLVVSTWVNQAAVLQIGLYMGETNPMFNVQTIKTHCLSLLLYMPVCIPCLLIKNNLPIATSTTMFP